jgi:hypothetical protein
MPENRRPGRPPRSRAENSATRLADGLTAATLLGALLLAISQFLPLFHTRIQASRTPIDTVMVGSAHAWGLLPIALLVAWLGYGVWRTGSRPALVATALLGVIGLVISLVRDLPYAERSGIKLFHAHYVLAVNRVAVGLYLETLGATVVLVAAVSGLILFGPSPGQAPHTDGATELRSTAG